MDRHVVDFLAAARITRLITKDSFPPVAHLREWFLDKVDPDKVRLVEGAEPPALAELIECNWCAGFWVSAGVVAARRFVPGWWEPVALAFATSMVVGQVAGWSEQEGDIKDLTATLDKAFGRLADAVKGLGQAPVGVGVDATESRNRRANT